MKCPYCEKEMAKGNIFAGDFIRWWPEGADRFMTVPEEEGAVRLHTGGWVSAAKAESWYCADCRMVITPVPEIEDPFDKAKKKWDAFKKSEFNDIAVLKKGKYGLRLDLRIDGVEEYKANNHPPPPVCISEMGKEIRISFL